MGRLQSSVGLITGTDIVGTVDQLIKISGQPRDRLVSRNDILQRTQQSIAELTASVIGVQLSGSRLANASLFQSKKADSTNKDALSVTAGTNATVGKHVVRTLATAATHSVRSLQRFDAADTALGFTGSISVNPRGGSLDGSVSLAKLNDGRGVEGGKIRITDRSGSSAEIDLSGAQTIDEVLTAINDADIGIKATTDGAKIKLIDLTGSTESNLKVEQLGNSETAADLGLYGIDDASSVVSGINLVLPSGVTALRGTSLSELGGGLGLGTLGTLDITLSNGSSAAIDLSGATTTSEVIDAIEASGLSLIVKYNDARNGLQIRDVSGGTGNITISSADTTATKLGLEADTTNDIIVGKNLNRQSVTSEAKLADLNQGKGIKGSFTITDSSGGLAAINIAGQAITTVGGLVDAINALSVGVTASLNEAGDGIAIVDTAGGSGTLKIKDAGSGTAAKDLGIVGTATSQTIGGSTVSALVGSQAGKITVESTDTLTSLVKKINQDGRYGEASVQSNGDGTVSLRIRGTKGGEGGQFAINTSGFELDLRTESRGQDALIAVSTDNGLEQFLTSTDGVFDLSGKTSTSSKITASSLLTQISSDLNTGSFTITDSNGKTSAINLRTQEVSTVGELIEKINELGIGVTASVNEAGDGIAIVDTAAGSKKLKISDVGNGKAALRLGIAGEATTKTIGGLEVSALVGSTSSSTTTTSTGLSFTLKSLSADPITVSVTDDSSGVTTAAKTFVDQYNKLIDKLDALTIFDQDTNEVGLLFGSSEANRITSGFSRLLSSAITGAGTIKSIGQVGISFNDKGKLALDTDKLTSLLDSNRADVEQFFTTAETGLANRVDDLSNRIAGVDNSLLLTRNKTLADQIEQNGRRIDTYNTRLDRERERLLKQFYSTETAISKIQSNSSAIDQIQRIEIPT